VTAFCGVDYSRCVLQLSHGVHFTQMGREYTGLSVAISILRALYNLGESHGAAATTDTGTGAGTSTSTGTGTVVSRPTFAGKGGSAAGTETGPGHSLYPVWPSLKLGQTSRQL